MAPIFLQHVYRWCFWRGSIRNFRFWILWHFTRLVVTSVAQYSSCVYCFFYVIFYSATFFPNECFVAAFAAWTKNERGTDCMWQWRDRRRRTAQDDRLQTGFSMAKRKRKPEKATTTTEGKTVDDDYDDEDESMMVQHSRARCCGYIYSCDGVGQIKLTLARHCWMVGWWSSTALSALPFKSATARRCRASPAKLFWKQR